jgi:hypothetical protein
MIGGMVAAFASHLCSQPKAPIACCVRPQRDVLMPFDSRGGGGPALAAAITLDDLADSLQAKCPAGDAPALFRWAEHEVRCGAVRG